MLVAAKIGVLLIGYVCVCLIVLPWVVLISSWFKPQPHAEPSEAMDKESAIEAFRRENRAMPLSTDARIFASIFLVVALFCTIGCVVQAGNLPRFVWAIFILLAVWIAGMPVLWEKILGDKPNRTLVLDYSAGGDFIGTHVKEA